MTVKDFCMLLSDLRGTADESPQLRRLRHYLASQTPEEQRASAALLSGDRPSRLWTRSRLKTLCFSRAGLPLWLAERCLDEGADVAETLARCWPREGPGLGVGPAAFLRTVYPGLADAERLTACWDSCRTPERVVVNRLLLGQPLLPGASELVRLAVNPSAAAAETGCKEVEVELMYVHFPDYSFGRETDGRLTLFTRLRVEDPALLRVLLAYTEENLLEKKGPVQLVRRGLRGRIRYRALLPSPRHQSGFKVKGAELVALSPPDELWEIGTRDI